MPADDVHLATPAATLTALAFEPANGDRALLAAWDGVRVPLPSRRCSFAPG